MTKNHFVTLGLQPGCTEDEVKKAYRSLARKFHPDKNKDTGAEEKFKEIAAAYEVLINQDRREIHEREVNRPKHTDTTGFKKNEPSASKYEEHSSWSKKFGKESENTENRYKNSTFGSFADEGRHPAGHKYEKKTNSKPKKKQSTRSRPRRPWSHEWTEYDTSDQFYDIPEPRPRKTNFSFAFKSFVDDLGVSFDAFFTGHEMPGVFEFSAFFDGPDPFDSFFRKGTPSSMNTGRSQAPPHKRDVAPEAGAEGIDEEYLFTSRSSHPGHPSKFTDYDVGGKTFDSDDDMDSRLFKCTYCHKRMKFSQLSTHEPGCALRHGGRFDVDDDEQDGKMNDDDIFDGTGSPEEDQYPQKTGDWRQTHEELLRNIRRAKQAARSSQRRYSSSANTGTAKETKDEGIAQVRCQWCGRSFSHPAAKQHIPFCEKWTKDHGTPLNPAGKGPTRDIGSKNQKARQYAKNIPRPRGHSSEGYDSDSPRTSRSHFDSYPNVGVHMKRETMNKPGASSGTGLHASYSPREKSSSPGPGLNTSGSSGGFGGVSGFRSTPPGGSQTGRTSPGSGLNGSQAHTARGRTTTRTTGAKTKPKHTAFTDESPTYTSRFDDSYGFGLSGSRVKPETRPREHNCPICKKRYGLHGRFTCTCGVRKTGS